MQNKLFSYVFLSIFLICLFINYQLSGSLSPNTLPYFIFIEVASVLLAGFFYLKGLKKGTVKNKVPKGSGRYNLKLWATWIDFVPGSALAIALVSSSVQAVASTRAALLFLIVPSYLIFLVSLVVTAVGCVLISSNNHKPVFWRVLNLAGVVILLLMIPFFLFVNILVLSCAQGTDCYLV